MANWRFLLLTFLFIQFSFSGFGLGNGKHYTISGEVKFSSFYQGGVDQGDVIPEEYPLSNETFVLVRLDSINDLPKRVLEFTTSEDGRFKLKVTAGLYGIILKKDLGEIVSGQYLPSSENTGDSGVSTSIAWRITGDQAISISKTDIENIQLIRYTRTVCYLCP